MGGSAAVALRVMSRQSGKAINKAGFPGWNDASSRARPRRGDGEAGGIRTFGRDGVYDNDDANDVFDVEEFSTTRR
jgi:hypothetical protein